MAMKYSKNSDVIKAFNHFKADTRLHPEILWTGCIERTKIICDEMNEKMGLETGYICVPEWGFSDYKVSCKAKLQSGKEHEFFWTNHFVPFVLDEQGEKLVLDICLMNGPERLKDWRRHILFEGQPLAEGNYSLNHPNDRKYLSAMMKGYNDPVFRLSCAADSLNEEQPIVPFQKKSKWLSQQTSTSLLKMAQRGRS